MKPTAAEHIQNLENKRAAVAGRMTEIMTAAADTGTTLEADFPYQKGGPENPLSPDEVREKFRGNASLALPDHALDELEDAVLGLEGQDDLRSALSPLSVAGVAV